MTDHRQTRTLDVERTAGTPLLGTVLGYGTMIPFIVFAVGAWIGPPNVRYLFPNLEIFWGASILLFLAGVRRGAAFRADGASMGRGAVSIWLFLAGFLALFATIWGFPTFASVLLILGYLSLAFGAPVVAGRTEAPAFFPGPRPLQVAIPILCLAAVLVLVYLTGA